MAASRLDTWMPLYIGDYLADTTHLTTRQHGAYLLLIFALWRTTDALLDDNKRLASIAKETTREWREDRAVLEELFIVEEGTWRHKRVDQELEKTGRFRAKQAANGSKGGRPRKNPETKPRKTQTETQEKPSIKPNQEPSENPNQSTHNHNYSKKESASPFLAPHERARDFDDPGIEQFIPEGESAPDTPMPAFMRRHLQKLPIPPSWRPDKVAVQLLRAQRPDITDERIERRLFEFHNWCAAEGVTSQNPVSTWLNFMVKTHVDKSPSQGDEFDDPGTRAIAAAVARRYPNG